jgi:flagellar biosynthesis protein FlhB
MAVSSYPFQPHQLIVLFNWILIFAFVGVALYMSVQMNRDTLLSNLNGTKPGELSWDREFVSRILLYVVIPILGFLGVQFPDTIGQIFSFLAPGAAGHG